MWAFGNEHEPENVKQIMHTNLAQEFSERRVIEEKHDG